MRKKKLENLSKRGNTYYIDYYNKAGQRVRITTETDVEDLAKEFRDEYFKNLKNQSTRNQQINNINAGFSISQSMQQAYTFDDVALKFLNDKKRVCRENTYKKYFFKLKNITSFFTETPLKQINKLLISNYCDYRFINGCNQSLLREELSVLNNVFNFALELDMVESNPLLTFKFKKKFEDYKPRLRYLEIFEIKRILDLEMKEDLIKIQTIIILETGMRINEALNALFTDISMDKQSNIPFLIIRKEISKNSKEGYIPLSKTAMSYINTIKIRFPNSSFIFVKKDGNPHQAPHQKKPLKIC